MKRLDRIEKWLESSLLSKLCEKLVDWFVWDEDVPENEKTLKTKKDENKI